MEKKDAIAMTAQGLMNGKFAQQLETHDWLLALALAPGHQALPGANASAARH